MRGSAVLGVLFFEGIHLERFVGISRFSDKSLNDSLRVAIGSVAKTTDGSAYASGSACCPGMTGKEGMTRKIAVSELASGGVLVN